MSMAPRQKPALIGVVAAAMASVVLLASCTPRAPVPVAGQDLPTPTVAPPTAPVANTTSPAGSVVPPSAPVEGERWSDPATWNGQVPGPGAQVVVPAGRTIVLDTSPPPLAGLRVDGTLVFDRRDLDLTTANLMVHGRLEVGTPAAPFMQRAVITLTGGRDAPDVMGMGSKLIGVMGGTLDMHGAPRTSWVKLGATAEAGDTTLTLDQPVDWQAGDRLVVTSTDYSMDRYDEVTVVAVEGLTVTVAAPLAHRHHGELATYGGTVADERAEVGLLSRNVVIRGDDASEATGFGGHVMAMAGSTLRGSGIELTRMGQAGTLGRYPWHFHKMRDATGSFLRSSSVHNTYNRGIALHGTDNTVVQDNVVHDHPGHGVFLEDGSETGNQLVGNLVATTRIPEDGQRLLESDGNPDSFWLTNPDNIVVGNVAAGSNGGGFHLEFDAELTEVPGATSAGVRRGTPLAEFRGNVSHSNMGAFFDPGALGLKR